MWTLLVIAGILAVLWLGFSGESCPACGLRLAASHLDRIDELTSGRLDRCGHCGWERH
jgi:hypothetical protein